MLVGSTPADPGRLAQRQICAVSLNWLDVGRGATDDQLAQLEHDGRLVILQPGMRVVDDAMAAMPPRPAVNAAHRVVGPVSRGEMLDCWACSRRTLKRRQWPGRRPRGTEMLTNRMR